MPSKGGWTWQFYKMELPMDKINTLLFHEMIRINEKAGQAWLFEAVFATPIPIWSGASRASFAILASKLGTYIPSGPRVPGCPFTNGHATGKKYDTGTQVYKDKGKSYVGFQFATRLPHLIYNENFSPTPGPYPAPWSNAVRFTPYNFEGRALKAWKTVAKKAKLPNPFKWLKVTKI